MVSGSAKCQTHYTIRTNEIHGASHRAGEGLRSRSGSFSAAITYDGSDVDRGWLVQGDVGEGVQWVGFPAEDGVKVAGGGRQGEQLLTEGVRAPVTATQGRRHVGKWVGVQGFYEGAEELVCREVMKSATEREE